MTRTDALIFGRVYAGRTNCADLLPRSGWQHAGRGDRDDSNRYEVTAMTATGIRIVLDEDSVMHQRSRWVCHWT